MAIMGRMWTRAALEARVEKLAEEHEGPELVEAIRLFAEQLGPEEREILGRVLLDRAPGRTPREVTIDYPRWHVILPRKRRR